MRSRGSAAATARCSPACWREIAGGWRFDPALNGLIEQHNEWYPVERRLPMNPRTGDYVPVGGPLVPAPRARARMGARAVPGVAAGGRLARSPRPRSGRQVVREVGERPRRRRSVTSTRSSTRTPPSLAAPRAPARPRRRRRRRAARCPPAQARRLVDLEADPVAEAEVEALGQRLARRASCAASVAGGLEDVAGDVVQRAAGDARARRGAAPPRAPPSTASCMARRSAVASPTTNVRVMSA